MHGCLGVVSDDFLGYSWLGTAHNPIRRQQVVKVCSILSLLVHSIATGFHKF